MTSTSLCSNTLLRYRNLSWWVFFVRHSLSGIGYLDGKGFRKGDCKEKRKKVGLITVAGGWMPSGRDGCKLLRYKRTISSNRRKNPTILSPPPRNVTAKPPAQSTT